MKIFEVIGSERQDNVNMVDLIKEHCQPYLKNNLSALKEGTDLYRGVSKVNPIVDTFMTVDVWTNKNRKPTHTPLPLHFLADMWMEETFGYAYRSSSCFASTDYLMASRYGSVYGIFPIGEYEMLYSPKVGDLYEWYLRACEYVDDTAFGDDEQFVKDTRKYGLQFESNEDTIYALKQFKYGEVNDSTGQDKFAEFNNYLFHIVFPRLGYRTTKYITDSNGNECMLRCKQYYAVAKVKLPELIKQL